MQGWNVGTMENNMCKVPCTSSYGSVYSSSAYDLTNSQIYARVVQLPNTGNGSTSFIFQLVLDSNNGISIQANPTSIAYTVTTGGIASTTSATYDGTAHKWWQIRASGSNVYFETSADGLTWTTRRTVSPSFAMTSLTAYFTCGYWDTEPNPGYALIDHVNYPPIQPPRSSGWVVGAAPTLQYRPASNLVFEDTFGGSSLDTSKWDDISLASGTYNNELQTYVPGRTSVSNNTLTITASKDGNGNWQSSRLHLKPAHRRKYGYFEATIKCPNYKGAWPAFWLLGEEDSSNIWPKVGEIDIFEGINSVPYAMTSLHGPQTSNNNTPWDTSWSQYAMDTSQWHTFGIDVRVGKMTLYIDNAFVTSTSPTDMPDNGTWPFDSYNYYIILNLAVGGTWPGSPDGTTPSSFAYQVRNVRIYA